MIDPPVAFEISVAPGVTIAYDEFVRPVPATRTDATAGTVCGSVYRFHPRPAP